MGNQVSPEGFLGDITGRPQSYKLGNAEREEHHIVLLACKGTMYNSWAGMVLVKEKRGLDLKVAVYSQGNPRVKHAEVQCF